MGAVVAGAKIRRAGDICREDIPAGGHGWGGQPARLSIHRGVFRAGYHSWAGSRGAGRILLVTTGMS